MNEFDTVELENGRLRALLAHHGPCAYGERSMGECSQGFPGCGCADDILMLSSGPMPDGLPSREERLLTRAESAERDREDALIDLDAAEAMEKTQRVRAETAERDRDRLRVALQDVFCIAGCTGNKPWSWCVDAVQRIVSEALAASDGAA